ncbi:exodeoxyribonuclease V subunit beta [Isoalcanivorax beigongshangi]|uniref:RecBCD enzyme subunit RecB n=1 Tax=Isoalcanivorax beigongshangi TaxID=3238810 RepID=A0ABV4AG12_9GAMM
MHELRPIDLTGMPLHGLNLIEASAGTGKTYSIAALYLRLVLGIGCAPVAVENLLVVTFTRAAVAELRGRVRARLVQARGWFQRGEADEPFGRFLLDSMAAEPALALLERAITSMDNAAIFTIHGFCQRVLKEYALDMGVTLDAEFVDDDAELFAQAVNDLWRAVMHPQQRDWQADALLRLFGSPSGLAQALRPLCRLPLPQLVPDIANDDVAAARAELEQSLQQARELWQREGATFTAALQAAADAKQFNGSKWRWVWAEGALKHLDAFAAGVEASPLRPGNDSHERLLAEHLLERAKAGATVPTLPGLAVLTEIAAQQQRLAPLERAALLRQCRDQLVARREQLMQQRSQRSADDLLVDVDRALQQDDGERLAAALCQRYPVALVDEFQDTDPVQYRIFRTLYRDRPDTALFMIGDPKQAIYRFRGADIHAYLQAAEDCPAQQRYTLDTNFRSSSAMVAAVNRVFAAHPVPFVTADIPFHPVKPAGGADQTPLQVQDSAPRGALTWAHADAEQAGLGKSKERSLLWSSNWVADEIAGLLQQAAGGSALIGERPLAAGDMAVLVRTHNEARAVRAALSERGIASVYRGRDSVLSTAVADDLGLVLAALVEPEQARRVRAALATSLLGWPMEQLQQRFEDERQWTATLEQFRRWGRLWRSQGVLPALYALLEHEQVLPRLRAQTDGERKVTDLLHLAELLQQAAGQQGGPRELHHWYQRQRQLGRQQDVLQLRLESEDNLVQVVTIHASKGLQYPLCFVLGMSNGRALDQADLTLTVAGQTQVALSPSALSPEFAEQWQQQAEQEALAEDVRLLYVALTRSVHRCYVLHTPVGQGAEQSALAWLLQRAGQSPQHVLDQLCGDGFVWTADAPPAASAVAEAKLDAAPVAARPFRGRLQERWRISSYTALTRQLDEPLGDFFEAAEPVLLPPLPRDDGLTPHSFPRGASAGVFLHAMLEDWGQGHPLTESSVNERLTEFGFDAEQWQSPVLAWMQQVIEVPLGVLPVPLAQLSQRLPEMEFMLSVPSLTLEQLDQQLDWLPPTLPRPPLVAEHLAGMLRGFIDLTFEYQGRYYLLDYKSNWLGARTEDYTHSALARAMAEHRYDLQAAIYALALHRHLRLTLPDYDPDQHFGGVLYQFLRGVEGPARGVWHHRPDAADLDRLDHCFGAGDAP